MLEDPPLRSQQAISDPENSSSLLKVLDDLPMSSWHLCLAIAFGFVWVFDGYEVSLVSLFGPQLANKYGKDGFKGLVSCYQLGCITGSIGFGAYGYRKGRKAIFMITLLIYFISVIFTMVGDSYLLFAIGRFGTGISVGGQFTAIFAAVDQFLPRKFRGRVNIGIDGTWHLGGALASLLSLTIGQQLGSSKWQLLFGIGLLGVLAAFLLRRNMPQSPRWLLMKGYTAEASQIVKSIEQAVSQNQWFLNNPNPTQIHSERGVIGLQVNERPLPPESSLIKIVWRNVNSNKLRFFVSITLIFSQALFFNQVYYHYPLLLASLGVAENKIGLYMLPISISSFLSAVFVGRFFDTIGRKTMLLVTYVGSGILLLICQFVLSTFETPQTRATSSTSSGLIVSSVLMCITFLFSSPASSSANLIASQIFPTDARTPILSLMFIFGMLGGLSGNWVEKGGYYVAAAVMILAGFVGWKWCPSAENKGLESV